MGKYLNIAKEYQHVMKKETIFTLHKRLEALEKIIYEEVPHTFEQKCQCKEKSVVDTIASTDDMVKPVDDDCPEVYEACCLEMGLLIEDGFALPDEDGGYKICAANHQGPATISRSHTQFTTVYLNECPYCGG